MKLSSGVALTLGLGYLIGLIVSLNLPHAQAAPLPTQTADQSQRQMAQLVTRVTQLETRVAALEQQVRQRGRPALTYELVPSSQQPDIRTYRIPSQTPTVMPARPPAYVWDAAR